VPGWAIHILDVLTALLQASVVVLSLVRGCARRYLTINLYLAASTIVLFTRYYILSRHGLLSSEYIYFYYYSDALLTIGLYFTLMGLYATVFEEMKAKEYLRLFTILLLIGTAGFSYAVVQQSGPRMITRYVVEMSQNLYFVGVVLTYILWGAILKLREMRSRVIQLVLSLGVYFSAFAGNYALRNLYPQLHFVWESVPPVLGCLLPLSWAYAFWRIPEDARLAPSRLAAVPR
jgi:hypothetical protein